MPADKRPGKKGIYVELPSALDAEFRKFVSRFPLGTISQHIAIALRRHMDTPPVVEVPALAPATLSPDAASAEKPAPKKKPTR